MRGPWLVVEGVPPDEFHALAVAADGSIAELHEPHGKPEGVPTSFRRPRRIEVRVAEPGGAPVPGIGVQARGENGSPWSSVVRTDDLGRATIDGLAARALKVNAGVTPTDDWGLEAGDADVTAGDARVDVPFGRVHDVAVRVRVDGEPRLPSGVTWSVEGHVEEVREDADAGVLRFRVRPREADATAGSISIGGRGYLDGHAELPWALGPAPIEVEVDLVRAGVLVSTIAAAEGARLVVAVEALVEAEEWTNRGYSLPQYVAAGVHRWEDVPHGTYRLRDVATGLVSEPVEVRGGKTPGSLSLDLTRVYEVSGRVVVPEGYEADGVRLQVLGPGIDFARPGSAAYVRPDGSFRVKAPAGRPVTLRVAHATLRPAPDGGSVAVTGPRDNVVLRLVEGPTATLRLALPDVAGVEIEHGGTVALYLASVGGEAVSTHDLTLTPGAARFGGFTPGTYAVWIDFPPFAPRTLDSVALGAGRTDLGPVALEAGSSIRVRVVAREGTPAPEVWGRATRKGDPEYDRELVTTGGDSLFRGLGPGTFDVAFSWEGPDGESREAERVVVVDGRTDSVLDLDVR
jgi:hypothetical protein